MVDLENFRIIVWRHTPIVKCDGSSIEVIMNSDFTFSSPQQNHEPDILNEINTEQTVLIYIIPIHIKRMWVCAQENLYCTHKP